ncbi:hypothetical protein KIL84_004037, partial [Mauremys mutica]
RITSRAFFCRQPTSRLNVSSAWSRHSSMGRERPPRDTNRFRTLAMFSTRSTSGRVEIKAQGSIIGPSCWSQVPVENGSGWRLGAMAARSQVKDLQEAVICSICLASFNDSVILIKCGHNFCRSCITQYCKEFKTSPPYPCPQCREPFREGEFQPNRELRNVVEIAKKIPEPRGKKACEKHEELLKLFCEVDQTLICLVCRESHSHKDHSLLPVKEAALDYKIRAREVSQPRLVSSSTARARSASYGASSWGPLRDQSQQHQPHGRRHPYPLTNPTLARRR